MKLLIVNGDDFAYTTSVNEGILLAHRQSILKSTTLMPNGRAFEDAVQKAAGASSLSVGVHLTLVGGAPTAELEKIPSLTDSSGNLVPNLTTFLQRLHSGRISLGEVEYELRSQILKVKRAGIDPTHLDSHKHTHIHPDVFRIVAALAAEFEIGCVRNPFETQAMTTKGPLRTSVTRLKQRFTARIVRLYQSRWRKIADEFKMIIPDHFLGFARTGMIDRDWLHWTLTHLPEGTTELMCHPAVYDRDLEESPTRLKRERERELHALMDPELQRLLDREGVRVIGYRELKEQYARRK